MRQRSTAPLLAVILAAVLSRGKSFSQSLASHAICLPDTGMRRLLPFSSPSSRCCFFLNSSLSLFRTRSISFCHLTFSPHISPSLFSPIITPPALFLFFHTSTSSIHCLSLSLYYLLLPHQFLSKFPPLTISTLFPIFSYLSLNLGSLLPLLCLSPQSRLEMEGTRTTSGCAPYPAGGSKDTCGRAPSPW